MFPEYRSKDISVLTFNVTWHCPVRCRYCYRALSHSHDDITILKEKDVIKYAQIASKCGINEYRISGGEPVSIGDRLFDYADIIYEISGSRPILMTSGFMIDDKWLAKAPNKFSTIAVSVDNPLESEISKQRILPLIKQNMSDELPLTYGLTLIKSDFFKDIATIFDFLYEYVDYEFMPQLDYPCLGFFCQPSIEQLKTAQVQTRILFNKYGVIPYYFVYLIGSLIWLENDLQRYVLNLHPEGSFQIYDSLIERWQLEYRWKNYIFEQQQSSNICKNCSWLNSCRHHPLWDLRYDWCGLRKVLFEGIYEGLEIGNVQNQA